jgi:hypothetical protein
MIIMFDTFSWRLWMYGRDTTQNGVYKMQLQRNESE